MITQEDLDNWFTYHAPSPEQQASYTQIRDSAKGFAACLLANVPQSADLTAAMRKLREVVMTANAAIACTKPPEGHYRFPLERGSRD